VVRILLNEAMKAERAQALGAGAYERSESAGGMPMGSSRRRSTRLGSMTVQIPQVRGEVDFYPSHWSGRAQCQPVAG
jgi:transposase-like protein